MGLLSRLFKREEAQPPSESPTPQADCLHAVLRPHWDSLDDLGHKEKADSYSCETCNQTFSPEEGERLEAEEAERLRLANIERLRQ